MFLSSFYSSSTFRIAASLDGDVSLPCLNKHCIFAASEILHSIDSTVDPCDDFYAYSCNQWIKNNPIPDGKSMWGTFGKLEQQNQLVVKNVLERPEAEFKSKSEKKAKLYYQSCLDEDETMEKLGADPLLKLLKNIGGWNITANVTGFDVKKWSLQKSLQVLQIKYNMGGLFGWAVGEDDRNSSRHIIQVYCYSGFSVKGCYIECHISQPSDRSRRIDVAVTG